MLTDDFYGDRFRWFIGVVKDTGDDKSRVRVRIFGIHHTEDQERVSDGDLPWALVLYPTTGGQTSGGNASHGLVPGTWVMGFFADGEDCQQPVVVGVINGGDGSMNNTPGGTPSGGNNTDNNAANPSYSGNEGGAAGSANAQRGGNSNGGTVVVGDSIAVGTGQAMGVPTNAKVGASSSQILTNIKNNPSLQNQGNAVLSVGSNDIVGGRGNVDQLRSNLGEIRSTMNAGSYTWILPADPTAAATVRSFAAANGDKVVSFTPGGDGIHPKSYGAVANSVREQTGVGSQETPTNQLSGGSNQQKVYNYFWEKISKVGSYSGDLKCIVAALVGNFEIESGCSPGALNPNDKGMQSVGIAQWRAERRDKFLRYHGLSAFSKGAAPSLEKQLDYVWMEFHGDEKKAYFKLITCTTLQDAVAATIMYERDASWRPTGRGGPWAVDRNSPYYTKKLNAARKFYSSLSYTGGSATS